MHIMQVYCVLIKIDAYFCNKNVTDLFYSEGQLLNLQENTHELSSHFRDNRYSRVNCYSCRLGQPDGHRRF